jgi:hypothetical protein
MAGVAYFILVNTLTAIHGGNESLAEALGSDLKGKMSVLIYLLAIILTFVNPVAGLCLIAFVAAMWLIPDRRIEKRIAKPEKNELQ